MTDQSFEVRDLHATPLGDDSNTEPIGNIQQVCRHLSTSPDKEYAFNVLAWCLLRSEYQLYITEILPKTGHRTVYEWTRIGGTT